MDSTHQNKHFVTWINPIGQVEVGFSLRSVYNLHKSAQNGEIYYFVKILTPKKIFSNFFLIYPYFTDMYSIHQN